jgi:hypothetical protein
MYRALLSAAAFFALFVANVPASNAPAATQSAPADEYFGRFKYSALSVRTKIDELARAYASRWADDASIVHDAGLVEDGLHAWVRRYPSDPWAPSAALHLAELYARVQSPSARAHAIAAFRYVAATFPRSVQGHLARLRLAQGFPPLQPESPVDATPYPYLARPSPTPVASPLATESPTPVPFASPPASATPSPVPR